MKPGAPRSATAGTARRSRRRWPETLEGRRRLKGLWVILACAALGYIAAMIVFPAPLVSRDTPLTQVIGMAETEAIAAIERQGFKARIESRETDPMAKPGTVLWQDPPSSVELTPGAQVRLIISEGPPALNVPDLAEFEYDHAVRILAAGGLQVGSVDSVSAAQPAGVVISTRPAAGSTRPPGGSVDLIVSRGPSTIRVPDLTGMDRAAAQRALAEAGLRMGTMSSRPNILRRGRPGTITDQRPGPGTLVAKGSRVDLIVTRPEGS